MTTIRSYTNSEPLTIVTVFKSGPYWWPEYVYRLKQAVERNLSCRHRFVCISDIELDFCDTLPLIPMSGADAKTFAVWWKIQMHRPEHGLTGPTMYIDLDTLVIDDFADIVGACRGHPFLMTYDPWKGPPVSCSALMYWQGDHSDIWQRFSSEPLRHWIDQYQLAPDRKQRGVEQAFVADTKPHDYIQNMIDSAERIDRIRNKANPGYAAFLFCSGNRKPWNNPQHPDVRRHWFGIPA
jgi:hypothetical protein